MTQNVTPTGDPSGGAVRPPRSGNVWERLYRPAMVFLVVVVLTIRVIGNHYTEFFASER